MKPSNINKTMKKFFFTLLLAAMLPCVCLKAQKIELSPSVQETIQSLPDSLRKDAFNAAMEREFSVVKSAQTDMSDFEDVIIVTVFFAVILTIVIVCVCSARRKQQARNDLISKMVDNGVFNNTNADAAEMIKAMMPVKKTRTIKDRVITYNSLLGIGVGLVVFSLLNKNDNYGLHLFQLAGFVLIGFGLWALCGILIFTLSEKKKAKEQNTMKNE